jgi:hypothetical protein
VGHFRRLMLVLALAGAGFCGGVGAAFAAAGAAPLGPIDAVKSGADLKLACGQRVEGFDQVVGEKMYRSMLIVQCRAVVGTICRAGGCRTIRAQRHADLAMRRKPRRSRRPDRCLRPVGRAPSGAASQTCGGGVRRSDRDEREVPQLSCATVPGGAVQRCYRSLLPSGRPGHRSVDFTV